MAPRRGWLWPWRHDVPERPAPTVTAGLPRKVAYRATVDWYDDLPTRRRGGAEASLPSGSSLQPADTNASAGDADVVEDR